MRTLTATLCVWLLVSTTLPVYSAQDLPGAGGPGKLNIVIVEGEGAVNNIRLRTAREPIVQIEDENHKPVAGAAVVFTLPSQGASGTFANGARSLTVMTDNQGRAVARGLKVNKAQGKMQIRVNASHQGRTASTIITQTNMLLAGAAAGAAAGVSGKLIAILVIAAGAAAGGAYAATHAGGGGTTPATGTTAGAVITPGTGTVGPPH